MKYLTGLIFLLVFSTQFAFAQGVTVKGKATDSVSKKPLVNATVVLSSNNSDFKTGEVCNKKGEFEFKDIPSGLYSLKITYVGHEKFEKEVRVRGNKDIDLGSLAIRSTEVKTSEVEVTADAPIGEQKQDTTVYNANSFKTQKDATTEDLVKKIPGIDVGTDGSVKAHGEDVKKVLVDGKPFFGDDPTLTLRNLPAEVVDKVQVFDKMSDQAEFSGFDDGQTVKALNIITKKFRRNGQFGKANAGYGYQDKYNGSLNLNLFNDARRISVLGISNNVNQQNFSIQDILGMSGGSAPGGAQFARVAGAMSSLGVGPGSRGGMFGGRGGGGGDFRPPGGGVNPGDYMVGQMDGRSTTHALGFNYSDSWAENVDLTGSYFFNYTNNNNTQNITRDYLISSDSSQNYYQNSDTWQKNINHRFNFKFTWQIDSSNSIMVKPNLTSQANNQSNNTDSRTLLGNVLPLNSTKNDYSSNYSGLNFSNDLLLRHRFATPRRTFSVNFSTSYNDKLGYSDQMTENDIYRRFQVTSDSAKLKSDAPVTGYGLSANAVYTEPLHTNGQLQVNYTISYNSNNSDKKTWDYDAISQNYSILDTLLSNKYDNNYLTNNAGIGYRLKEDKLNLTVMANYQQTQLNNSQEFPYNLGMSYKFNNFLPSMRLNYRFSTQSNFGLHYRASTNMPSISQLQNVVDNTNPMQLSSGNPSLKQQYSQNIVARFTNFSPDFANIFVSFISFNFRTDYIANSNAVATKDTIVEGKIRLPAGGQISKPVNMDGFYNLSSFFTYGFPLRFISSNINLNLGGIYTRTPSLVNNIANYSNAYNLNAILVLSSNISENLDFTLSSRANINMTKNTLRVDLDNKYNGYTNNVSFKWIFWEGFFAQGDLRNQIYTGLVGGTNNNFTLLNLSLGKKLFADNTGEIKLSAFDVLNQNKSTQTNVTDYYVEYSRNIVLQQYIMLTFTYNLRRFATGN